MEAPRSESISTPEPQGEAAAVSTVAVALADVVEPAPEAPVEVPSENEPRAAPVPVELPPMPTGEMQVASPWDLMEQGGQDDTGVGSESHSTWARRAIEVDFSAQEGSSEGDASGSRGEVPLASVLEFVPSWDPSAQPADSGASFDTSSGEAQSTQLVRFQDALEALRQATTRGALGKALLAYCQGRFPRGFLLGETFGLARVERACGFGSNKLAVTALQVDLEAPSLLARAATEGKPTISSVPESPEDEALFAALGESFSHLMAAPIRLYQCTVGYFVVDGGPVPFGTEALGELEQLIAAASDAYDRMQDTQRRRALESYSK
jgi:hypothetical protein